MRSIRNGIFLFSILSIVILTIPYIVFVFFHFLIVNQYDKNIQRIVLAQNIPQYTADTIQNYYYFAADVSNNQKKQTYDDSVLRIRETLHKLDNDIQSKGSLVQYQGLKNLTNAIINRLDTGIKESEKGNILNNSTNYEESNHDNVFAKEISGKLVLEELHVVEETQKEIQKTHMITLALEFIIFILTILSGLTFGRSTSVKITQPLEELASIARRISQGNMDLSINQNLLTKKDETGTLAQSFYTMVVNLKNKIQQLEDSEKSIKEKNQELERFNKLVINRELRMIELKKKIQELEAGSFSQQATDI